MRTLLDRSALIPFLAWTLAVAMSGCGGARRGSKGPDVERTDAAAGGAAGQPAPAPAGTGGSGPSGSGGASTGSGGSSGAAGEPGQPVVDGATPGSDADPADADPSATSADAAISPEVPAADADIVPPSPQPPPSTPPPPGPGAPPAPPPGPITPPPGPGPIPPPPPPGPITPPPPPGPITPPPPPGPVTPPPGPVPPPAPPPEPPVPPPPPGPGPGLCGAPICPAVSALLAACQPAGACALAAGPVTSRQCYANGVKVQVTPNLATLGVSLSVTRPDGVTPCYRLDVGARLPDGARLLLVRDGAGNELSRGVVGPDGRLRLTCAAGTTDALDDSCVPLARPEPCRPGVCR